MGKGFTQSKPMTNSSVMKTIAGCSSSFISFYNNTAILFSLYIKWRRLVPLIQLNLSLKGYVSDIRYSPLCILFVYGFVGCVLRWAIAAPEEDEEQFRKQTDCLTNPVRKQPTHWKQPEIWPPWDDWQWHPHQTDSGSNPRQNAESWSLYATGDFYLTVQSERDRDQQPPDEDTAISQHLAAVSDRGEAITR